MPFYTKQALLRVYSSWNASKRGHTDRYIQVAYGNTFLQELKNTCSKNRQDDASQGEIVSQSEKRVMGDQEALSSNNPLTESQSESDMGAASSSQPSKPDTSTHHNPPQIPKDIGGTSEGTDVMSLSPKAECPRAAIRRSQRKRATGDVSDTSASREAEAERKAPTQSQEDPEVAPTRIREGGVQRSRLTRRLERLTEEAGLMGRRRFAVGRRTRLGHKRAAKDSQHQSPSGDTDRDGNQGSGASALNALKDSSVPSREGDSGSLQKKVAATSKVLRLRQTARKHCPPSKRQKGLSAQQKSQPEARPIGSQSGSEQAKGMGSFGQPVSVNLLRMEASKMRGFPTKLHKGDFQGDVGNKQASSVKESSDVDVEGDINEPPRPDPATTAHEEGMVSTVLKESAKTTWKSTHTAGLHSDGAMDEDVPRFGNPQSELGFPKNRGSRKAASWRKQVAPDIRLKQLGSFHEDRRWDVGVVASIDDGPLLEGDDGQGSATDESEMASAPREGNYDSSDASLHSVVPSSRNKVSPTDAPEPKCSDDEDIGIDLSSVVNESVEDEDSRPPSESPLPGLSGLNRNRPAGGPPPEMNVSSSPVFSTCPKITTKPAPSGVTKMTRAEPRPKESAGDDDAMSGAVQGPGPHGMPQPEAALQEPKPKKGETVKERGDGRKKGAAPAEDRSQSTLKTDTMGDPDMVSCLSGGIHASGTTSRSSKDTASDSGVAVAPDVARRSPSAAKRLAAGRKIRTAAEKKQGRVRGQSGWEESLRQRPTPISKFQAGDTPKAWVRPVDSRRQQETGQEKKRWQSPKKVTPSPAKPASVKSQRPEKTKRVRNVWQPPPAKKLKLSEDAEDEQRPEQHEQDNKSTGQSPPPKKFKLSDDSSEPEALSAKEKQDSLCTGKEPVLQDKFQYGELVWGKMKGFNWWPATVIHHHVCGQEAAPTDACWLKWFGDDKFSKVNLTQVSPFSEFSTHFSQSTLLHTALYRKAVFKALQVAASRAGKTFSTDPAQFQPYLPRRSHHSDPAWQTFYDLCHEMTQWAQDQLEAGGQAGIAPSPEERQIPPRPVSPSPPPSPVLKSPPSKRAVARYSSKSGSPWKDARDLVMPEVRNGMKCIEDICIGCGSSSTAAEHPFFVGGLCEVCRVEFLEAAYVFDEDGYQSFCCICAEGKDIILCDQPECYRSFCHDCVDHLVGPGTVEKVLAMDNWKCYMCDPEPTSGQLSRRPDWPHKLLMFFQQDSGRDFQPLQSYPPVEMHLRRPIRVLSLFDGIGTGMLVLKELGLQVECYYASEISEEAKQVSSVRHDGILQLGDVQSITAQEIESLGPFDLVIGGSPCNDLSIANPARKGLFEGTGRLFFDFYRILMAARPQPDSNRPFFWLFENVVGMRHKDKVDISRFLQCAPVVVDAKDLSPAHRARYFWGNLPGMNRPNIATDHNNLNLQDCLEPNCNRQAQFSKVRTVTSKLNSIKQKNEQVLPVLMNGQEDTLWCTEMERIFGFPEHYTDIANMSRSSRHKLIGKAWSVPVIKHLLAPLKEYFACETQQ